MFNRLLRFITLTIKRWFFKRRMIHKKQLPELFSSSVKVDSALMIHSLKSISWFITGDVTSFAYATVYVNRLSREYHIKREDIYMIFFFSLVLAIKYLDDFTITYSSHFKPYSEQGETLSSFNLKEATLFNLLHHELLVKPEELSFVPSQCLLQNISEEAVEDAKMLYIS